MQFIGSVISGAFGLILLIVWVVLVIYAFMDIIKNVHLNQTNKVIWAVIIFIIPIVGSLLYIFWERNQNFL